MFEVWFPNLNIKIKTLNKVAFTIFGLDVYWYGILIAIGVILALFVVQKEAKRLGQNPEVYADCLIYTLVFSILFARIYYVIFSWDYFKNNLNEIFYIRNGGIAIYGGIIGAGITIWLYTKIKKLDFLEFTDTAIIGLLIGQIIGRWGNFINREAFGGYTDSLFAMRYLKNQVNNLTPDVLNNIITIDGVEYIQVHPAFLYESLWNLGVLIIILLYRKNKRFNGEISALYFILYGIGRVWIESLRTDSLIITGTNIAVSQLLSIILIIVFTLFIFIKSRKHNFKNKQEDITNEK